eukprot:Selendium_serpulae@DN3668_c0_g1_i1.p1
MSGPTGNPKRSNCEVFLHPLVVMNISSHITRSISRVMPRATPRQPAASSSNSAPTPPIDPGFSVLAKGVLIGTVVPGRCDVRNSFEFKVTKDEGTEPHIDLHLFASRLAQFAAVLPELCVLGFYSVGRSTDSGSAMLPPNAEDISVLRKIMNFRKQRNDPAPRRLFHLLIDPTRDRYEGSHNYPVEIFEVRNADFDSERIDGAPASLDRTGTSGHELTMQKVSYVIESGEAERIAVQAIVEAVGTGESEKTDYQRHLSSLEGSVGMLGQCVDRIIDGLDREFAAAKTAGLSHTVTAGQTDSVGVARCPECFMWTPVTKSHPCDDGATDSPMAGPPSTAKVEWLRDVAGIAAGVSVKHPASLKEALRKETDRAWSTIGMLGVSKLLNDSETFTPVKQKSHYGDDKHNRDYYGVDKHIRETKMRLSGSSSFSMHPSLG